MTVSYNNNATTTLAAGINDSVTTLTVFAGTGTLFPDTSGGDHFYITLEDSSLNREIVKVTARSTDTFTIVRAQDGTSALSFSTGDRVELRVSRILLQELSDAENIDMSILGTPTYTALEDWFNTTQSAGKISGGVITDGGSGTINISAATGILKTTDSSAGENVFFDIGATTGLALTDNVTNWIYIDYNSGTPIFGVSLDWLLLDLHTQIIIGSVYRVGTAVHITEACQCIDDMSRRMMQRTYELYGNQRASGMVIGETGTRNITVSAGVFYVDSFRGAIPALNTATGDTFDYIYRNGAGGWTAVAAQTQINNLNYDDGDGTLGTLTSNRYGVHWVYLETDGDLWVQYGQGDYTLAQAQAAAVPATSDLISSHAILIGKIIIQQGAASFTSIESSFAASFSGTPVSDHGALAGLADDDHIQYALLAGRSGGQTLIGGTASGNSLTLSSTSNATKGNVILGSTSGVVFDAVNNRLGIGTATPDSKLEINSGALKVTGNTVETIISYSDRGIFGTFTNHNLEIRSNNTAALTIDTSQRVGIGTSTLATASAKGLTIDSGNNFGILALNRSGGTANRRPFGLGISGTSDNTLFITSSADTDVDGVFDSDANYLMTFNGSNKYVGIGKDNPTATLDIENTDGQLTFNGYRLNVKQKLDLITAGMIISGESNIGTLASIQLYQTATGTSGGYIAMSTSPVDSTTPAERMRIDSAGNVGIGGSPSEKLHIFGDSDQLLIQSDTSSRATTSYRTGTASNRFWVGERQNDGSGFGITYGTSSATDNGILMDTSGNVTLNASMYLKYTSDTGSQGIKLGNAADGFVFSDYNVYIGIDNDNSTTANTFNVYHDGNKASVLFTVGEDGNATVQGYTKLGSTAPAIKKKLYNVTLPSEGGSSTSDAHGLTGSTIISVRGLCRNDATGTGNYNSDGKSSVANYTWSCSIVGSNIELICPSGDSSAVAGKPAIIVIEYTDSSPW